MCLKDPLRASGAPEVDHIQEACARDGGPLDFLIQIIGETALDDLPLHSGAVNGVSRELRGWIL